MTARRLLVRGVVAALCVTAAVAIAVLVSGSFRDTSWRILVTTSAVSFFGLLALPAGMLLERTRLGVLARGSAALTAAGFVLTLLVTWTDDPSSRLWKVWGVVTTLALAAAQAATVEARRRDTDNRRITVLTGASTVTAATVAGLGIGAILASVDSSAYYRGLGAVGVLDVLLVAVVAVLRRAAGPVGQTHRMRIDGRLVEAPGRDFAAAAAAAIREAERDGTPVRRLERA